MPKKTVQLPSTEKEFDDLVSLLIKTYKFKDRDQIVAVLASRIQHMPPDQQDTSLDYLAGCVRKNMAYLIAGNKMKGLNQKHVIEQIQAQLDQDPNDQQARDALQIQIENGNIYAKSIADK